MKLADGTPIFCMNSGASGSTWAYPDPARLRQSLIGRKRVEPFALWLQGREVLYEEKFYCVIRVARVVTNEHGMEALAIPRFGFRFFDYHPEPPREPWTFGFGWADVNQHGSEISGGMFSPTVSANADVISRLRSVFQDGRATREEVNAALRLKGEIYSRGENPCPWVEPRGSRFWYSSDNGEITVSSWKDDWFDEYRRFAPLEHLRKIPQFFVNYGPHEELTEFVFGTLLRQPGAADVFRRLLEEESRAAQLYGLRGLFELDAPDYPSAHARYRQSTTRAFVQRKGEPLQAVTMAEVARRIQAGEFRITNEYYFR